MEKPIMEVRGLKKWFEVRTNPLIALLSRKGRYYIKAVDGLNFDIYNREILGLVGESGCGKTTTGRLVAYLIEPTKGEVLFEGRDISSIKDRDERRRVRRKIQMIFQDPYEYLSPWLTVKETLEEPLRIHNLMNSREGLQRVKEMMELVDLTPVNTIMSKYPHQLSGGQRQRVVIARALMLQPKFLVADEPVSMVDVSIRLGILNLLLDLRDKYDLSYLYITHDIASARYMCDRIAVMYLGRIVELGSTDSVINSSTHPYTKALMSAVPVPNPKIKRPETAIKGRIQAPIDMPLGCRFHPRCPYAEEICRSEDPELREVESGHLTACHFPG